MTARLFWLMVIGVLGLTVLADAMPRPPGGATIVVKNEREYYQGTVSIKADADTSGLKELGFRNLQAAGHLYGCARYDALWPKTTVILPMPDWMTGLDYEATGIEQVMSAYPPPPPDTLPSPEMEQLMEEILSPAQSSSDAGTQRLAVSGEIERRREDEEKMLSIETNSAGNLSEAWFLHYPLPADSKPDTVISGRDYVRGNALCASAKDTIRLKQLGFVGMSPWGSPVRTEELADVQNRVTTVYHVIDACWPPDINVRVLPNSVPQIIAKNHEHAPSVFSNVHLKVPPEENR